MTTRFTEEQSIGLLREAERPNASARAAARRHNITETTFYRYCNKYGGMDVSDARRLKSFEAENARLKKLAADRALAIDALKEFARRK